MGRPKETLRSGVNITKGEHAVLVYLENLQSKSANAIITEAFENGLVYMSNDIEREENTRINRPPIPKNSNRIYFKVSMELRRKMGIVKANNDLLQWNQSDFIRLGLRRSLRKYAILFPEIEKIVKQYERLGENESQNNQT